MADDYSGEDQMSAFAAAIARITPADQYRIKGDFEEIREDVRARFERSAHGSMRGFFGTLDAMWDMLNDGEYALAWEKKSVILVGLSYFVCPSDAIPEFVPVIGFENDAVVIAWMVHALDHHIAAYAEFRRRTGNPLPDR